MKKFFLILIITFISKNAFTYENSIIYKVNNEIITTFDVKKESNYLRSLNPSLNNLDMSDLTNLSIQSIIKEKIKKIELEKNYTLGANLDDPGLLNVLEGVYKNIGQKNEQQFIEYLTNFDISIEWIKKKLEIESLWNKLIYDKYKNQISIDIQEIREELTNETKLGKEQKKFFLSEILIKFTSDQDYINMIDKINKSIEEIGFNNTASIFSISDTADKGGKIGWINQTSLSPKILNRLKNLKEGENTKPIKLNNNFLILKIEDMEITNIKIDFKKALNRRLINEQNKQLDKFSTIFFNRVKQNIKIDG
tara:strand:- start:1003 stop:1929 length:927 start_codon:yes stop_codon:yes gene_type:complete